jgi:hypothetical protein
MSQDKEPLFPRESESDSEAQSDLLKDVRQKLEVAERTSEFKLPDFGEERFMPSQMDAHSPPPPAPAYGPPPSPVRRNLTFVFILVGFLLVLFAIYMVVTGLFIR